MTDKTYNGWSNYATWRINLEVFDGMEHDITDYIDEDGEEPDAYEFALALEDLANEIIFSGMGYESQPRRCWGPSTLAEDYARAFLQDVNWHEIAKHYPGNEEGDE